MTDFARIASARLFEQEVARWITQKRLDNIFYEIDVGELATHLEKVGMKRAMCVIYDAVALAIASPLSVEDIRRIERELDDEI